eukprot:3922154-Rhodomonas_salina.4
MLESLRLARERLMLESLRLASLRAADVGEPETRQREREGERETERPRLGGEENIGQWRTSTTVGRPSRRGEPAQ